MKPLRRILLPLLFWLLVWQLAATGLALANAQNTGKALAWTAALAQGHVLLLPAPFAVISRLAELAGTALFWRSALLSLVRIFTGLAVGVALGTLLAALTWAFKGADLLLSPAVRVVRATPVASFIVLVLLWVRTGLVPGVISGLMVFPVVWETVRRGIGETSPELLELAQAYGFSRGKTLRLIYIPSVLPYFTSGVLNGLGLAWKSGVAAEVLCQPRWAVGTELYRSKISLDTPALFGWTLVVLLLSLVLERALSAGLRQLERRRGS